MTNFGLYAPNSGRVVNAQLKVLIADITLTNPNSFEAIPIPAGFDHLVLSVALRSTVAATGDAVLLYYNNDLTAANYSNELFDASGTTLTGARADTARMGQSTGSTATANSYGTATIMIFNVSTNQVKNALISTATRQDATTQRLNIFAHNWESTEPIKSVTIRTDNHATDLFTAGSRVQVFGVGTFAVALAR